MDAKGIIIPVDMESRGAFRQLERALGKPGAAALVFFLFRELAYAAENAPVGVLRDDQAPLFADAVKEWAPDALTLLSGPVGLLSRAPDNSGWLCPLFAQHNRHFSPDHISLHKLGGLARGVKAAAQRLELEGQQQSLLLDPALFRTPEGNPFTPDETRKVMMLIRLFDNYLGRRERRQAEFTPGLVLDAWRVLHRHSEACVQQVCLWFHRRRDSLTHPGLPRTTEQVLADFAHYASLVEAG